MSATSDPSDLPLSRLLRAERPSPPLPPRFREDVWRRVETNESTGRVSASSASWLEQWIERLFVPRYALASLTLLLVAGGLTGALGNTGAARQQAQAHYLAAVAPSLMP